MVIASPIYAIADGVPIRYIKDPETGKTLAQYFGHSDMVWVDDFKYVYDILKAHEDDELIDLLNNKDFFLVSEFELNAYLAHLLLEHRKRSEVAEGIKPVMPPDEGVEWTKKHVKMKGLSETTDKPEIRAFFIREEGLVRVLANPIFCADGGSSLDFELGPGFECFEISYWSLWRAGAGEIKIAPDGKGEIYMVSEDPDDGILDWTESSVAPMWYHGFENDPCRMVFFDEDYEAPVRKFFGDIDPEDFADGPRASVDYAENMTDEELYDGLPDYLKPDKPEK